MLANEKITLCALRNRWKTKLYSEFSEFQITVASLECNCNNIFYESTA